MELFFQVVLIGALVVVTSPLWLPLVVLVGFLFLWLVAFIGFLIRACVRAIVWWS